MADRTYLGLLATLIIAALAGCDGAVITVEPHTNQCDSPKPAACYMIKNNTGNWIYETLKGCDTIPESSQQASSGACAEEGKIVDICDSPEPPPGAPVCYAILPSIESCPLGNCATEYRVTDFCGVRGQNATAVDDDICNGIPPITSICDQLDKREYYSTTLGDGGRTPNGVAKMHWRASFNDGELIFMQSDFGIIGNYACDGNQVVITINSGIESEHILELSQDLTEFKFNPLGGETLTYRYSNQHTNDSCQFVSGKRYSSAPANSGNPEEGPTFLAFSDSPNTVEFGYGDIIESGYYDCQFQQLHVHLNNTNEPMLLDVERHGIAVTILGKDPVTLPEESTPVACDLQYQPVCAAFNTGIQCVTTPCSTEIYKTYSNRCFADAENAEVMFEGECGKLENEPLTSNAPVCPPIYAPTCAKHPANIVCVTSPCESHEYKTFTSKCDANNHYGMTAFSGNCDNYGLEGLVSLEHEPAQLDTDFANYDSYSANIISARFEGDLIVTTISYSGCNEQNVHLHINTDGIKAMGKIPTEVDFFATKENNEFCLALFTTEKTFDLTPLKAAYFSHYPDKKQGVITFSRFGSYEF